MFQNIIDKDFIVIDQDDNNSNLIRLSWFKDNHFQGELFLNLENKTFDRPELRNRVDWYCVGEGQNIDIYFSYNNKYLSIDIFYHDEMKVVSRNYKLDELFEASHC